MSTVDGNLDPKVDFARYRALACRRFIAIARGAGYHRFFDLKQHAEDLYSDFWVDWLDGRSRRQLVAPVVPYIVTAMMNKLRSLNTRGHSLRPSQFVGDESGVILMNVATKGVEPDEQLVIKERLWFTVEVTASLPPRERVVRVAVDGRDSKKKDAPPAGYKLAAKQLGISEVRAKKLSLRANKRIHAAVERFDSGTWCERWARSIELVAAGKPGETGFRRHAEHCVTCRMAVVRLREQATLSRGSSQASTIINVSNLGVAELDESDR
jgi:DNA-directed RNA polymerase specialized sigma24 family protein